MGACEVVESLSPQHSVTIQLAEHFDYRSIHHFQQLYQGKLENVVEVVVDMAFTRYVDSSGIALLLCLYQWLSNPQSIVRITHCRPAVRQVLALARCDGKFIFD
jgi:anti-anti-sigma factor